MKLRFTVKIPNTSFGAPRGWIVTGKTNDRAEAEKWAAAYVPRDGAPEKYRVARIIDNFASAERACITPVKPPKYRSTPQQIYPMR